jgi:hypothetical protein
MIFSTKVAKPITNIVISIAVFISITITSFSGIFSAFNRCRRISISTQIIDYKYKIWISILLRAVPYEPDAFTDDAMLFATG